MIESQELLKEANDLIDRALHLQNVGEHEGADASLARASHLVDEAERLEGEGL